MSVSRLDADQTRSHASREDTSVRLSEVIVLSSGVALLAAVGLVLIKASHATGGMKAYLITLGVLSVALTWALVHTVFTLRYARTFLRQARRGNRLQRGGPAHLSGLRLLSLDHRDDISSVRHQSDDQEHSKSCPRPRHAVLSVWSSDCRSSHQCGCHPSSLIVVSRGGEYSKPKSSSSRRSPRRPGATHSNGRPSSYPLVRLPLAGDAFPGAEEPAPRHEGDLGSLLRRATRPEPHLWSRSIR